MGMSLSRLTGREKAMSGACIVICVVALSVHFVVGPMLNQFKAVDARIRNLESQVSGHDEILSQSAHWNREFLKIESYVEVATPDMDAGSKMSQEVERLALEHGVQMKGSRVQGKTSIEPFEKYTASFVVEGFIPEFMGFLYYLEDSKALLRVEKLEISPNEEKEKQIKAKLTISKLIQV